MPAGPAFAGQGVADAELVNCREYFVGPGATAGREEQVARAVDRKSREYAAQRELKASRLLELRALQLQEARALEQLEQKAGALRVNLGAEQPGLQEAQQLAPERAARRPEQLEQPA